MSTTHEIVEAIISGDLSKAQELYTETVKTSIQGIIAEQRSAVAAEVFGTSIVEKSEGNPFAKDKEDKSDDDDGDKKDKKKSKDSDKKDDDDDKDDKDKKPPFGKKDD